MTYNFKGWWTDRETGDRLLGSLALISLLICIINCFVPQVEMFLTGGSVPVPQGIVKIACFSFLAALVLLYRTFDLSSFPAATWFITAGYLLLVFPYLWFVLGKPPGDIILEYNAYYCPLIFVPLAAALRARVREQSATRILLATFAACAVLGWAQFLLRDPIIQLVSNDGNFGLQASSWYGGAYRATGFFGFALEYGGFAVLIAALGIGMCGERGGWKLGVPLYLIAAATVYSALTRVVFLQLAGATVAALTFTLGRRAKRVLYQPLLQLAPALVIAFGGIASALSQKQTFFDNGSLELRLQQWGASAWMLLNSSPWAQLFGFGLCQAGKRPTILTGQVNQQYFLTDNQFIAVALHIGLVGLGVILVLFWAMWRRLQSMTAESPTPLKVAIASYWSTFALTGMFSIQLAQFGFWFLVALIATERPMAAERMDYAPERPQMHSVPAWVAPN